MAGALDGLLVADFSRVLSGPYATMLLGDMGADVIKVENPHGPDETRAWGPPWVAGESSYYVGVNRNKRSIAIDFKSDEGLSAAHALANRADIVVENFRPGTMDRFGLGYEQVAATNPGVIYASLSGFGDGAGRELPGYDFLVQAVGGLMSITGPDPQTPTKAGVALVDVLTGLHLVIGTLAALQARQATGRGQHVKVNLMSSLLSSLVNQASTYVTTGKVPVAMGNAHPSIAPYQTFQASDRPFVIAVGNDKQFRALAETIGAPALADDPDYATNPQRVAHRETLAAIIDSHLAEAPADKWVERLMAAGIPAGLVNTIGEAFDLATAVGLDPIAHVGAGERTVATVANPIRLSDTPVAYRLGPPALGEHTEQLLRELGQG